MKIRELIESRGEAIIKFADYVARLEEIHAAHAAQYQKIGIGLFKEGFTYDDTLFYKFPDEGGLYEIFFPAVRNTDMVKRGDLQVRYYVFKDGKKFEFNRTLSLNEVDLWTVPTLLKFMKEAAR